MKKNIRPVLRWILTAILIVGIIGAALNERFKRAGEDDYADAAALASKPMVTTAAPETISPETTVPETVIPETGAPETTVPETTAPETIVQETEPPVETLPPDPLAEEMLSINLSELQAVNEDVIGWIRIPGTELDYPLLQGTDNSHYLKYTWKDTYSALGSIFLDYRNTRALSDFNTIIYGHQMWDNRMFGELKNFKKQDYRDAAPYIYLLDEAGTHKYEIFAAYEATVDSIVYKPGLTEEDECETLLTNAGDWTVWDVGITPTTDDRILTLVTCTGFGYHSRWIVQGVLVEERAAE